MIATTLKKEYKKSMMYISGTIHLTIAGIPAEFAIQEIEAAGGEITTVGPSGVSGMIMGSSMQKAKELIVNGWEWK